MQPPRFVFCTNRRHPERPGSVLCRLTLDKQVVEFTTPVKCLRPDWDAAGQRVKGSSKAARLSNAVLIDIAADLNRVYYDMERAKEYCTAERVVGRYRAGSGPRVTLLQAWAEFVAQRRPLVGLSVGACKVAQDEQRGRLLTEYLTPAGKAGLLPQEFTGKHADAYLQWLRVTQAHSQNYAAKILQTTKQVLRWCVRQEYCPADPLASYGLKFAPPSPPKFLTPEELARLTAHTFAAAPLRAAADCFLFQCYTGLAYVDLARFRASQHTRPGPDGLRWLYMDRSKTRHSTGQVCTVRLLVPALRLLAQYGERLPVPCNQVYNRYLKEIAAVLELADARLTSHTGRKTAGALLLADGMSLDSVSKVLGHSSVVMTQRHYCDITSGIVAQEFRRVYGLQQAA